MHQRDAREVTRSFLGAPRAAPVSAEAFSVDHGDPGGSASKMRLEGSCHCGAVRFRGHSRHPVPYQRCYCSICRKTGGAGGYMINIAADARTWEVDGNQHVAVYRAPRGQGPGAEPSRHARHFCSKCGSHLWAAHDGWPELIHPVAAAVDSELPVPTQHVHMMVQSKASWVEIEGNDTDLRFEGYPAESLADFHERHGWTSVDWATSEHDESK